MDLKELLLKDLSARFSCGVICKSKHIEYDDIDGDDTEWSVEGKLEGISDDYATINSYQCELEHTKPFLRPISSMTEEELKEYKHLIAFSGSPEGSANFVDWLNKKMFAYRTIDGKDMFELGLAHQAPKDMYR